MKSQTAQRPDNQRQTRSAKSAKRYVKQTAHVEARRDGKPLIFGWGAHLSRNQKNQIQTRAIWTLTGLIAALIVVVIVGFWINLNIVIPSQPIASVNGQNIPQSDYRKMVVVKGQMQVNDLQGPHGLLVQRDLANKQATQQQSTVNTTNQQIADLTTKLKTAASNQQSTLKSQLADAQKQLQAQQQQLATLATQSQNLQQTVTIDQSLLTQSQVGNDSVDWLQTDLLIRNWVNNQSAAVQAKIQPSTNAVDQLLNSFKANLPKSTPYNQFLSSNNISEDDLRAMLTVKARRDNMQSYLSAQTTSPAYQVLASGMTLQNTKDAQAVLQRLKNGEDFAKVAKEKSVDNNTKANGGDLGWMARGMYFEKYGSKISAVIDNWIFDQKRTLGELSPILNENGTYHIIQRGQSRIAISRRCVATPCCCGPINKRLLLAITFLNQMRISCWIAQICPAGFPAHHPASPAQTALVAQAQAQVAFPLVPKTTAQLSYVVQSIDKNYPARNGVTPFLVIYKII